jgi:hypothetical protein
MSRVLVIEKTCKVQALDGKQFSRDRISVDAMPLISGDTGQAMGLSFYACGSKKEFVHFMTRKARLIRARPAQPFEWNSSLIQGTHKDWGKVRVARKELL